MALWARDAGKGWGRRAAAISLGVALAAVASLGTSLQAQPVHPATPTQPRPAPVERGVTWHELTAQQKDDLRPLERDWATIDPQQKRKWLELTGRMPKLSTDERARIQARMIEWAQLTPEQRSQARLRYQQAKQVPPRDRQARWDAYQSLPTEQKRQLAERASLAASASLAARRAAASRERTTREQPQPKSNIVASPEFGAAPKPIAPTLVQARPGATTTSISRAAVPPPHQQIGMPKIAATPEYVNRATLLPRHGPQSASPRPQPAASAASASRP